jgi:hypothetical protein
MEVPRACGHAAWVRGFRIRPHAYRLTYIEIHIGNNQSNTHIRS